MRKLVAVLLLCGVVCAAYAVPAKRGWQTRIQADGTTIEVQQVGDEFYHYTINRDGQRVRLVNGMYEVVGEQPSVAKVQARRETAPRMKVRKQKQEFGVTPNLAPRGIVIMVNFTDQSFASGHGREVIDSLCNAVNCEVNKSGNTMYPSAGRYFKDQSNGAYAPIFDVFGPISLSHNMEYYGANDVAGNDIRPANMLVEACKKANTQYDVDFTKYDSDKDGKIDFVYILYAGEGEASGGAEETIWPHSYSVEESIGVDQYYTSKTGAKEWKDEYGEAYIPYFSNEYSLSDCYVDGKQINTYACSNELSGSSLDGIGTLCHEFGHVMGLPDFYETSYGVNSEKVLTPNDWDVMDAGAYNGNGHCPPNYSVWEKYFFGWHTPINLGNEGTLLTLQPNGTTGYQAYQITAGNTLVGPTDSLANNAAVYYIESRQQQGWDAGLPSHGMLIWQIKYSRAAWKDNAPNNEDNKPRYTLVSASGTTIGTWNEYDENEEYVRTHKDGPKNPYPGSAKVTSKTVVTGKPLKNIAEKSGVVTLTYIEEPVIPIDPFDVVFTVNGKDFKTESSTGKLVLPATDPEACNDGRVFVGWCSQADYSNPTTAPTFAKANDAVEEGAIFYAVFATQEGEGGEAAFDGKTGGTFKIYANAGGTKYYATATVSSSKVQSTTKEASAADFVLTPVTGGFTIKTDGKYLNYGSKTNVSLSTSAYTWSFEKGAQGTWRVNSATIGRAFIFRAGNYNVFGGYATSNVNGTEYFDLEIGGEGGASYSDYSTVCSSETGVDCVEEVKDVQKFLYNGQLIIQRGNAKYNTLGIRIE